MKYLLILLLLVSCGEYNTPKTTNKTAKIFEDFIAKSNAKSAKFKIDTVRNPNNNFLYYYIKADVLGYPGQYLVKMEDGQDHLTLTVNGKQGFLIWCLNNWEHYTDSLERLQEQKVKITTKNKIK